RSKAVSTFDQTAGRPACRFPFRATVAAGWGASHVRPYNPATIDARTATATPGREAAGAVFLAVLGVAIRLAFVRAFPTQPFWDFLQLVHFGELLRDHGPLAYGWYWAQFNPGLPLILSLLFRAFPGNDAATARIATAAATGLLPLLPYLIWRPVLTRRVRLLAGVLLAVWPGQVFFSGAVSQD